MTVANTNNRTRLSVSGTTYDFTFKIDDESEILVYGITSAGVATLLTLTTNYTVAISAITEGGTVTTLTSLAAYAEILMVRNKSYAQSADIPVRGGFNEAVIEGALDNLAMQIQQLKELTDFAVKQPNTIVPVSVIMPAPEDGLAPVWDGTTGAMQNAPIDAGAVATAVTAAEAAQTAAESAQSLAEAAKLAAESAASSIATIASQAEAEAASSNTVIMTPLRVKQEVEKSGAVTIPTANLTLPAQVGFGSWVDKSSSYAAQQATTDGFVVATINFVSGSECRYSVRGYTDANSDPTTQRVETDCLYSSGEKHSVTFPVKKNDYWKLTLQKTAGNDASYTITAFWIPLGS